MNMIELTPTETILYNDVVINNRLLTDQYIILGPKITDYTWTENLRLSSNGTITATGTISTTTGNIGSTSGNISTLQGTVTGRNGAFQYLAVTGGAASKPFTPPVAGVFMGLDSGSTAAGIEICASSLQYIDFTSPNVDYKGRIIYGWSNDFRFQINSDATARMTLNST
ncbi:MAG: hypothetical protein ACKPKO_53385, partial [Candidatus Fonsibacter sp.]